ncbi:MAG: restriction endonuclease subunit S [Acidobacteriota bacterium]|nr:restriction endonuclease subunit S [Blastocatellia bacterium]MDW8411847.1 restriction endonuclease subunit S [Acidobacteriota bacterium]
MASEWITRKIGSIGRVVTGKTPPTSDPSNFGGDYLFITIPDLNGRVFIDSSERTLSEKGAETLRSCLLPPGSVMMSCIATVGKCGITTQPSFTNQQINSVIPEDGTDPRFLYYVFTQLGHELESAGGGGSVYTNVSKRRFSEIEITIPTDVNEQRAIAHILGTLDDKIELNRCMSQTLEAMARALFKSWFIDFDPVKRNLARKGDQHQPSPQALLQEGRSSYRGGYHFARLVETARALHKKQTPAEEIFWELVRNRRFLRLKFWRQHQIGNHIAYFYCHDHRLLIELDGSIHSTKQEKDTKRDAWMKAKGFKVLRFKNEQLLDDPESVLTAIAQVVEGSDKILPSPRGRRVGDEGVVEGNAFDHLFPDRLVSSELGEIPEGWEVVALPELIDINPPRTLRKSKLAPYLEMANLPTQGHAPETVIERPFFGSGMRFINGDTLVARITPCLEKGKIAYVDFLQDGQVGWGSTEYIVLRPKPPLPAEFAYCLARSTEFREFAIQSMTGTTGRQRVQPDALSHFKLPRIPEPVAEAFGRIANGLFIRSSAVIRESRTLAALRNALLPKLIRGEIRVKDAERFLKERGL